jgi:hypothetical protein
MAGESNEVSQRMSSPDESCAIRSLRKTALPKSALGMRASRMKVPQ